MWQKLHTQSQYLATSANIAFVLLSCGLHLSLQPKQRTSLSSSLDVQNQRPVNHSCDPSEVSSSLGYASFSTSPPASPPVSPNQDSPGSNDDCPPTGTQGQILDIARLVENEGSCQLHLYSFCSFKLDKYWKQPISPYEIVFSLEIFTLWEFLSIFFLHIPFACSGSGRFHLDTIF
ncbi:unnamed protein product [Oncorhynchus mykiss]|uniref:Uncharacterized protein n=1 Tax=Oncorhynchus mykiss TaxID=8022 RepID=A0A060YMN7_ONCMY|nr:unnamed protein product [Oncorhynchus mykiss]